MAVLAADQIVINFHLKSEQGKLLVNEITGKFIIRSYDRCQWRFDWFLNADNPSHDFVQVPCPQDITNKSGCIHS